MNIYNDFQNISVPYPVATIGIFDGVHLGHREIIYRMNRIAKRFYGQSVLITLWPPPRKVFAARGEKIFYLTPLEEKLELLDTLGVDNTVVIPFTREFAHTSYSDFIRQILFENLKIKHIVVGFNHTFGRNREGTFDKLAESAEKYHFVAEQLKPKVIDNKSISSSMIRNLLAKGNVTRASRLLGYDYTIQGTVVEGRGRGNALGFPTANIQVNDPGKLIPASGVYAVEVDQKGKKYQGMMNIGIRPTFQEKDHRRIPEVHIFNFRSSIYGEQVRIRFLKRIREEIKFSGKNQLIQQIKKDKYKIMTFFNKNKSD